MDSSAIIKTNLIKDFDISRYLTSYELILKELEIISNKIKLELKKECTTDDRVSSSLMEKNQFKCHGFAWFETYRISLIHTLNWYKTLSETGKASRLEELILASGFSEYVLQMRDGIMMSQSEVIRPINNFGLEVNDFKFLNQSEIKQILDYGLSDEVRMEIVDFLDKGQQPNLGLNDETLEMIQDQFKKFTDEKIIPYAHEWHLKDELIPNDKLDQMAEQGV